MALDRNVPLMPALYRCAMPGSIGYLGKRDLVGLRGNWWDW